MQLKEEKEFGITVGKEVFLIPTGNARCYGSSDKGTIVKIGSKYFYVQISGSMRCVKFDKKTFESRCDDENAGYIIFGSAEERSESIEAKKMLREIYSFFRSYRCKISAASVRKIYEIIHQENE